MRALARPFFAHAVAPAARLVVLPVSQLRFTLSSNMATAAAFPAIPRSHGIASVTHRLAPQPTAESAIVYFSTTADLVAAAPSPLEAADAERETTLLQYAKGGDGTPAHRVLYASAGKAITLEGLRKATIAGTEHVAPCATSRLYVAPFCACSCRLLACTQGARCGVCAARVCQL